MKTRAIIALCLLGVYGVFVGWHYDCILRSLNEKLSDMCAACAVVYAIGIFLFVSGVKCLCQKD
jgi:hypothetical protein